MTIMIALGGAPPASSPETTLGASTDKDPSSSFAAVLQNTSDAGDEPGNSPSPQSATASVAPAGPARVDPAPAATQEHPSGTDPVDGSPVPNPSVSKRTKNRAQQPDDTAQALAALAQTSQQIVPVALTGAIASSGNALLGSAKPAADSASSPSDALALDSGSTTPALRRLAVATASAARTEPQPPTPALSTSTPPAPPQPTTSLADIAAGTNPGISEFKAAPPRNVVPVPPAQPADATAPVASAPVTSATITPAPTTSAPVTSAPVTSATVTPAVITTPVSAATAAPALVTSATSSAVASTPNADTVPTEGSPGIELPDLGVAQSQGMFSVGAPRRVGDSQRSPGGPDDSAADSSSSVPTPPSSLSTIRVTDPTPGYQLMTAQPGSLAADQMSGEVSLRAASLQLASLPASSLARPGSAQPSAEAANNSIKDTTAAVDPAQILAGATTAPVSAPMNASVPAPTTSASPSTAPLYQQLAEPVLQLRASGDGTHRIVIDLHPRDLGPVSVEVRMRNGEISVALASANEATRATIAAALPQLHQQLKDAGMSGFSLGVESSSLGFSGGGAAGGQSSAHQRTAWMPSLPADPAGVVTPELGASRLRTGTTSTNGMDRWL